MLWPVFFLACLLFIPCQCGEPIDCSNKGNAKTDMMRLKLDMLCGYDRYLRPVIYHTNQTTVELLFAPRIIDFDEHTSTLKVKTWIGMHWEDNHLTWNSENYNGIERMSLDTSMVWVPDLSVYNTKYETEVSLDQKMYPVTINHKGSAYVFMNPVLASHCVPNWANWPFDVHECTITLGSQRYMGSTVDFKFLGDRGLELNFLLPDNRWELVKTNNSRNETWLGPKNDTDSIYIVSLNYNFTLRRHASVLVANYLMPGVVMVVMSLGSLWMPSHRTERMAVLCFLMFLQTFMLHSLSYEMPSNGETTPYIVDFYRDCLFLTGLLIVQTVVTRSLATFTSNPLYLQSTFRLATSNKILQLLFVNDLDPQNAAKLMDSESEEGSTLVVADDNVQKWQIFVNIINRVCFILLVPVYLLLSISLMPVNYSSSSN